MIILEIDQVITTDRPVWPAYYWFHVAENYFIEILFDYFMLFERIIINNNKIIIVIMKIIIINKTIYNKEL